MAVGVEMDDLRQRAAFMRERLQKSQRITDSMVSILGSFDDRLSALESNMRPTQVRTHAVRMAHENIDKTLKSATVLLEQFDLIRQAELKIMRGPHEDHHGYLEAVNQLRGNLQFFSSNKNLKNCNGVIDHVNDILAKAIHNLEEEFKQVLSSYSKVLEPQQLFECLPSSMQPSTGSLVSNADSNHKRSSDGCQAQQVKSSDSTLYKSPTLIPPRVIPLLHDLAGRMLHADHQQQCVNMYRESRAPVLEESLHRLGVERLSKDDVQKLQWEVLESKIGNWIHFMRIAVKVLFTGERKVCGQIFESMDNLNDRCFAEVTSNSFTMLLSFADAIAKGKRSPEKLFVLLDMYEVMHELQPDIDAVFDGKPCSAMHDSAVNLAKRLAQTAHETFGDFVEAVEKDATKTIVHDGTVHPLTSYVINYVKFLFDYQNTLNQLFGDINDPEQANSQLALLTQQITSALLTNLDGKSKLYKDPALLQIFLMNNIHYIVKSVRRSEAKEMLGEDWVQRHRRMVQQHANQYKRITWNKVVQSLSVQVSSSTGSRGLDSSSSGISRTTVKERFKNFNVMFEELHQRQSQWTVPDIELRESLRLAVAEILLPAYRSFMKHFAPIIENTKNAQRYVKYTPEELDHMLSEFFEGKTWNEPKRYQ